VADESVFKRIRSEAAKYDPLSLIHMNVKPLDQAKTRFIEQVPVFDAEDEQVARSDLPEVLKEGTLVYVDVNCY
jgi:hypothetical protein